VDILLIDALGDLNYPETADAARRVLRNGARTHSHRYSSCPKEWRPELEAMAVELELPIKAAAAIEQRFREIVDTLDRVESAR